MARREPTQTELTELRAAQLDAVRLHADVAQARADLADVEVRHNDAQARLNRAIDAVLHGPLEAPQEHGKTLYELSDQGARDHWPSPPPTPGG
ncbi:hypothetical protein AB0F46_01755 [Streptomyces sp. NPDC026665]|uniref:hypothetical protein n=1 Tax=Streptomyces sp. NPDC026665 TaxID=3154798 RepID=UPI0033F077C2